MNPSPAAWLRCIVWGGLTERSLAMAGWKLEVNLGQSKLLELAIRVAKTEGFQVINAEKNCFQAKRGSSALSYLVGPFVAVCDFQIEVSSHGSNSDLFLTRNDPSFSTGFVGNSRVKNWAKHLIDKIAEEVELEEGTVLDKLEVK
jgi:hypothetical protein